MVSFYLRRIRDGRLALDAVPPRWRDAVAQALGQNGGAA